MDAHLLHNLVREVGVGYTAPIGDTRGFCYMLGELAVGGWRGDGLDYSQGAGSGGI